MYLSFVFDVMQRKVKPLHPGSIVVDILEDRGISVDDFSRNNLKLREVLLGTRPITYLLAVEVDLRLGISNQLLLNVQRKVDIWDSEHSTI